MLASSAAKSKERKIKKKKTSALLKELKQQANRDAEENKEMSSNEEKKKESINDEAKERSSHEAKSPGSSVEKASYTARTRSWKLRFDEAKGSTREEYEKLYENISPVRERRLSLQTRNFDPNCLIEPLGRQESEPILSVPKVSKKYDPFFLDNIEKKHFDSWSISDLLLSNVFANFDDRDLPLIRTICKRWKLCLDRRWKIYLEHLPTMSKYKCHKRAQKHKNTTAFDVVFTKSWISSKESLPNCCQHIIIEANLHPPEYGHHVEAVYSWDKWKRKFVSPGVWQRNENGEEIWQIEIKDFSSRQKNDDPVWFALRATDANNNEVWDNNFLWNYELMFQQLRSKSNVV